MYFSVNAPARQVMFSCLATSIYSGEILNKLKSRGFLASGLSTYDFSTIYTTLPHNLIKEKLTELIAQTLYREGSLLVACNDKNAFFTSEQHNDINCGHVRKCLFVCLI